jgi:hypothetical protein
VERRSQTIALYSFVQLEKKLEKAEKKLTKMSKKME